MAHLIFPTELGPMRVTRQGDFITSLDFLSSHEYKKESSTEDELLLNAVTQVQEFTKGERKTFDLPLAPQGTPFQKEVWKLLTQVHWGELTTYGELSQKLLKPGASRAVGGANNKNPIPLIIPCHRCVAQGGQLGGFAPGVALKRQLLSLEGHKIIENSISYAS